MPSLIKSEDKIQTQIVKQLEYYFSDINLRIDYFIKQITKKDSGWLPIEILMKFNRLNSLVNNNESLVIQSLKSVESDLIELNESATKVRRRVDRPVPQLDDQLKQSFEERIVEMKGFPEETTLDELMEWSKQFGSILSIRMKKEKVSRKFNGCVIITFDEKRMADNVINELPLKFKDKELTKETKKMKSDLKRAAIASNTKEIIEKLEKVSMDTTEPLPNITEIEGTVLQVIGLPRRVIAKEKKKKSTKIKAFFKTYGKVIFVASDSSGNCLVQFSDRSAAQKVLDSNKTTIDDKVVHQLSFDGRDVTTRLLSPNEEIKFWMRANKRKEKLLKKQKRWKKKLRKRANSASNLGQDTKRQTIEA